MDQALGVVTSHVVQAVTGIAVLYVLLRLLRVTDHAPTTALTFVRLSGLLPTLLGMLLQVLPTLLALGLAAALIPFLQGAAKRLAGARGSGPALSGQLTRAAPVLVLVIVVAWLLLVPLPANGDYYALVGAVLAVVVLGVAIGTGLWLGRRRTAARPRSLPYTVLLAGLLGLTLVQTTFDRELWLPAEIVSFYAPSAGDPQADAADAASDVGAALSAVPQDDLVGYVLQSDEVWTVILADKPRVILVLRTDTLIARTVCRLPGQEAVGPLAISVGTGFGETLTPECR